MLTLLVSNRREIIRTDAPQNLDAPVHPTTLCLAGYPYTERRFAESWNIARTKRNCCRSCARWGQQGLKVISLQDEGADGETIPLAEIDPFTFLASFNRGVTDKNRRDNWAFLKTRWGLKAAVPEDFSGILLSCTT